MILKQPSYIYLDILYQCLHSQFLLLASVTTFGSIIALWPDIFQRNDPHLKTVEVYRMSPVLWTTFL
jgi:hypothetical protein